MQWIGDCITGLILAPFLILALLFLRMVTREIFSVLCLPFWGVRWIVREFRGLNPAVIGPFTNAASAGSALSQRSPPE